MHYWIRFALTIIFGMALSVASARAANSWDGGGGDNNWSTGLNWDNNVVPTFPVALSFGSAFTPRLTSINDLTGITVNGMTINSTIFPAITIGGNAITLAGNIVNNVSSSTAQQINLPMTLAAAGTAITGTGSVMSLGGVISGSGSLTVGSGATTIATTNTYTGDTILNSGSLTFTADQPNVKNLIIGSTPGISSTGILSFQTGPPATAVNVTSTGFTVQNNGGTDNVIVGSGKSWTINGPINVGVYDPVNANNGETVLASGTSTSSMIVNAGSGNLTVGGNVSGTGNQNASLQIGGGSFSFTGSEVRVGGSQAANSGNSTSGFISINDATTSITADSITLGGGSSATKTGNGQLSLGDGVNTVNADNIYIGTQNSSGTLVFGGSATGVSSLTIRNRAGTGRTAITVGSHSTSGVVQNSFNSLG